MRKKVNLAEALQKNNEVKLTNRPNDAFLKNERMYYKPPSRLGKTTISGMYSPEVKIQLKRIAIDNGKTIQSLMCEALNDLFTKYGKPSIAE